MPNKLKLICQKCYIYFPNHEEITLGVICGMCHLCGCKITSKDDYHWVSDEEFNALDKLICKMFDIKLR